MTVRAAVLYYNGGSRPFTDHLVHGGSRPFTDHLVHGGSRPFTDHLVII